MDESQHISETDTSHLRVFSYRELKTATGNFRVDGLLGEDGFGSVFKGWVDEKTLAPSNKVGTGMIVAVKRFNSESLQSLPVLVTEVETLGRLSHPNLVKLLGYCSEKKKLLLVYEFMSKGSLHDHLFPSKQPQNTKRTEYANQVAIILSQVRSERTLKFPFRVGNPETEAVLSWDNRLKIATAAARAVTFLHSLQNQIIHRDIKPPNIFLDENYHAKLSGFGVALLGPTDIETGESYGETPITGTLGYIAPEYIMSGTLFVKSDVYSFGVVLLQMLTGLRAIDPDRPKSNLVDWAKPLLSDKRKFLSDKTKLKKFMDAKINDQYCSEEAMQIAKITLKCLAPDPQDRPSMKQVVNAMEKIQAIKEKSIQTDLITCTESTSSSQS